MSDSYVTSARRHEESQIKTIITAEDYLSLKHKRPHLHRMFYINSHPAHIVSFVNEVIRIIDLIELPDYEIIRSTILDEIQAMLNDSTWEKGYSEFKTMIKANIKEPVKES